MSMPAWLSDAHPFPNGDNGTFSHTADPSLAFMQNTPASLDYTQLQQNGSAPNGIYPTQSLIPSKRPRAREDSVAASPRQTPGAIPASRSQTPQQTSYAGFPGAVNGGHHFQASAPYQQFASTNNTTSPSPVMQNQMFNPQALPQRVQTGSPAMFSPPPQNFGPQASPVSSEHGSRNNTPQNGGHAYAQGMPYAGTPGQPFNPSIAGSNQGASMTQYNQSIQQQQRMHEIRQQQLMRQLHANNSAVQSRHHANQMNTPAGAQAPNTSYQMAARAQQAQATQQAMMRSGNPDQLIRSVAQYMQQKGYPFNPHPTAAGCPINFNHLFSMVMKQGGSKRFTTASQWAQLALNLQIPQQHLTGAAQELHNYWQANLANFESWYVQQQQQQRQRAINEQMKMTNQAGDPPVAPGQWSPAGQMVSQSPGPQPPRLMNAQMPVHPDYTNIGRPNQNHDPRQLQQNGLLTSQQMNTQTRQPNMYPMPQTTSSHLPQASTQIDKITMSAQGTNPTINDESRPSSNRKSGTALESRKKPLSPVLSPKMEPKGSPLTHGGLQVRFLQKRLMIEEPPRRDKDKAKDKEDLQLIDDLQSSRPWVPSIEEFGLIDIQALVLSLRSGLNAEVRLALDTLSIMSAMAPPDLPRCESLIEVLIECADEQVDVLAEHATEVSDDMLITSYDEMVRGCAVENQTMQEVPEFGNLDYELDRAVERLLCITRILRNLSFARGASLSGLTEPSVVKLMTTVIRYLGTRNMLLRTYQHTLDFSKDIIVLLSNVSQDIDLPGREEAFCLLHFLLSFAPSPTATDANNEELAFSHYNPAVHRYYPLAVDILAKLLARDDPNRTLYRSLFLADSTSSPPYGTLTRAFGLAIAGIPIYDNPAEFPHIIKNPNRMHTMAQGLLAAEILSGLIPTFEHSLARSWLTSRDSFASSLVEITLFFGHPTVSTSTRYSSSQYAEVERAVSASIAQHSAAVLVKLAERAKNPDSRTSTLPSSIMPRKKRFLDAMKSDHLNGYLFRQLCIYADMYS